MSSRLAVLVFTDLVGSIELKVRLGAAFTPLLARHNALFEDSSAEFHGEILKHTGDGFFAAFATASDAVRTALRFQSAMRNEPWVHPLLARVGIHIGEVAVLDMAGRPDVTGVAADVAARVMSLAGGGQILLTRSAFNDARQFVSEHPPLNGQRATALRWSAHGAYLFKGIDDPMDVFEVGDESVGDLTAPLGNEDAKRVVPHDQEPTLGWRPAVGLPIPGRPGWLLERKLGEGGFGEVWLGKHQRTKQQRVFKFCFDAERLRSFKREMTLFRLLREALGERGDIAKLYEVKLDEPPFFLESEHTNGGNLGEWAQAQGGLDKLPLEQRLEIVAQIADAVAAAHSVGVLHKDIKPSNVLIQVNADGTIQPRLADFGIGFLADKSQLAARQITATGFTEMTASDSSQTGTRLYTPPEVVGGHPFTIQGDVYALGVLLYQMATADLTRPLAEGWQRDVSDELLRDDIAACVEGDQARRLPAALELAHRLRTLAQRRDAALQSELQSARDRRHRRTIRQAMFSLLGLLLMMIAGGATAFVYVSKLREANRLVNAQRSEAERQKSVAQAEAAKSAAVADFVGSMLRSASPRYGKGLAITMRDVLDTACDSLDAGALASQPAVEAQVRSIIALSYREMELYTPAERQARKALAIQLGISSPDDWHLASAWTDLGMVLFFKNDLVEAEASCNKALEIWRRAGHAQPSGYIRTLNCVAEMLAAEQRPLKPICEEALQVLEGIDRSNVDERVYSYYYVGSIFSQNNDYPRAEALYRKSLKIRENVGHPDDIENTRAMNALARVLQAQHKIDEAELLYRKCIAVYSDSPHAVPGRLSIAWSNLATLLQEKGDVAGAEAAFRKDVELRRQAQPLSVAVTRQLDQLGHLLRSQGRAAEADNLMKEEADRGSIYAQNTLARQWTLRPGADVQMLRMALELAEKATAAAPSFADLWTTLGVARYRNGQWKDSVAAMEKSTELRNGGDGNNLLFLSMAQWQLGQREAARLSYTKAVAWIDQNAAQDGELRTLGVEAAALEQRPHGEFRQVRRSTTATTQATKSTPAKAD